MSLTQLSLSEVREQIASKAVSPEEVLTALRDRIEAVDGRVGGYLSHDFDAALAEARAADITKPLGGVPIAIKDVLNVKGQPCGCASQMLKGYTAPYDATAIRKLKEAGAIMYGRTNMDEFAMGSSTENSSVQKTHNPWDLERIPGGSSGGSAAVVAADEAFAALGTDTGGSIRQPASLCGIVGLKPTYGRVSRFGLVAFASSLDQIGPMTKTVKDSALLMDIIAGHDEYDSTSLTDPVISHGALLGKSIKGLKLGLPKEYFETESVDPGVSKAVQEAIELYKSLGAEIVEVSLPNTKHAVATYYIIATAEASANLARFDGVRYGHRAANPKDLIDHYGKTREEGFGPEVKRRIILGTYVLSSGYYDAYYLRAQKVRTLIREDFNEAFTKCDAILSPTSPSPAFKLGERTDDPLKMYLSDIYTIAVNLAGNCGLSIPCGFAEEGGKKLPVGLQIIGQAMKEDQLLQVAYAYEQAAQWFKQRPSL
jgi:aspartyl-tRNA(Asn)/glutamyl-tRNA(Gln) amidotransferase subunit A